MPSFRSASASNAPPVSAVNNAAARKAVFWNRIARQYAADPIADLAGYEATLRRVQDFLSHDQSVLEVGCGTGTTALRLAPSTRHWLATDVSTAMVAIAREKLALQPVSSLRFEVADADAPLPPPGAFDAVLAFSLLHLVSNLDLALQRVVQALRPGGLFISKTPCMAEMNPLIPCLALPLMRAIGKAPPVLRFNGDRLRSAIAAQGMEIVTVERHGTRGKDIRVFIVARKRS